MFENINLWFAKDKDDKIITIDKIDESNKHNTYTCPICGSEVIARTGDIKIHHFAHRDKSKCSPESMVHFWIKNELIKVGETFKIKLDGEVREYVCKEVLIEKSYETKFGVYKPDITILTENDEIIYFEVAKTNKKKLGEYLDVWLELDNIVVEVDVKNVLNGEMIKEYKSINYKKNNFDKSLTKSCKKICKKNKVDYRKYIDNMNWIMNDCYKYLNDELTIEELFNELSILEDKYIYLNILKDNTVCNDIYEQYKKYEYEYKIYKLQSLESKYNGIKVLTYGNEGYNILSSLYDEIYDDILYCERDKIIDGVEYKSIISSTGLANNIEELDKYISKHIEYIKNIKHRKEILNDKNFNIIIDRFCNYIKSIDRKYDIERIIGDYESKLKGGHPCNWEKTIEYTITYSDESMKDNGIRMGAINRGASLNIDVCDYDINNLYSYLIKEFNNIRGRTTMKHRKDFIRQDNFDDKQYELILKLLYDFNDKYKKVGYEVKILQFDEGYLRFTLENKNYKNINHYLAIYKNGVYFSSYEDDSKIFESINSNNVTYLYDKLCKIISDDIRFNIYGL